MGRNGLVPQGSISGSDAQRIRRAMIHVKRSALGPSLTTDTLLFVLSVVLVEGSFGNFDEARAMNGQWQGCGCKGRNANREQKNTPSLMKHDIELSNYVLAPREGGKVLQPERGYIGLGGCRKRRSNNTKIQNLRNNRTIQEQDTRPLHF
ncbi:hypothetical protein BDZ45DRAFT_741909 [Acephala macrosclerotiorum]|nr:hypothetical protein BDZ45DRAFT_741909 [Acephala macrosclerotiorum]